MVTKPSMCVSTVNVKSGGSSVRKDKTHIMSVFCFIKPALRSAGNKLRCSQGRTVWLKLPNSNTYRTRSRISFWGLSKRFSLNMRNSKYGPKLTVTVSKRWSSSSTWWTGTMTILLEITCRLWFRIFWTDKPNGSRRQLLFRVTSRSWGWSSIRF